MRLFSHAQEIAISDELKGYVCGSRPNAACSRLSRIRGRDMHNEPHGSALSKVSGADRGWGGGCQVNRIIAERN